MISIIMLGTSHANTEILDFASWHEITVICHTYLDAEGTSLGGYFTQKYKMNITSFTLSY
jgi:hypothetical protein